jgi:hypothetical protein
MKRIICPKHSKKNTLCVQIYLEINQARVQDEKQLGDKLQCVCYIVGNGFIECWLGVPRSVGRKTGATYHFGPLIIA